MSIGMPPFRALYGYDATTFADMVFGDSRALKAKDWIQESQDILKTLKDNLQTAQNQQKLYADQAGWSVVLRLEIWSTSNCSPTANPPSSRKGLRSLSPNSMGHIGWAGG